MDLKTRSDVEKEFRDANAQVRQMISKKILNNEEVGEIYGIFQQATIGDCNNWKFLSTVGQQLLDLGAKDKHCMWASYRGTSKLDAMKMYTDRVQILIVKYGVVFPDDPRRRYGSVASVCTTSTYCSKY